MADEANVIQEYVRKRIYELSGSLDGAVSKSELANLRRGVGKHPGEIPSLFGSFLADMPEQLMGKAGKTSRAEWAVYVSLTMFALHQQGHSESMNQQGHEHVLGRAVRKLVKDEEDEERIRRRFSIMASAKDIAALSYYIRTIIQLLRAQDIKLDYIDLAKDFYFFQFEEQADRIRLKWGQDFYRKFSQEENKKEEDEKNEKK